METTELTRRQVARVFGRLFDPLGLLGPFRTKLKLIMKSVTERTRGWNDLIPEDLIEQVDSAIEQYERLPKITFPRLTRTGMVIEIIGFADASKVAYGCVIYVRDCQSKQLKLLTSSSRLASHKRTIPELELCAAVILSETIGQIR